jgi:hypothetical protein
MAVNRGPTCLSWFSLLRYSEAVPETVRLSRSRGPVVVSPLNEGPSLPKGHLQPSGHSRRRGIARNYNIAYRPAYIWSVLDFGEAATYCQLAEAHKRFKAAFPGRRRVSDEQK